MKKWMTNSLGVMILTVISQGLGYIREIIFAYYLGTTAPLEAFQMAETLPMLFTQILISAVPLALTPLMVKEYEKKEKNYLINNAMVLFACIMTLIMGLMLWKTEWFVKMIAPGFIGDKFYLTCRLTVILAPNVLILSMAAVFNAYLSSKEQFIIPSMIYLILNVFVIVAQLLTKANVYYVAGASLSASIVVFSMLLFFMRRRFKFRFALKLLNKKTMSVIGKSILPVCIIAMFSSLNLMLDKFFASKCGEGDVVIFTYSYKIINIPVYLFTMSITKVMLPNLTRMVNQGVIHQMSKVLKKVFSVCTIGGVTAGIIIALLSRSITDILFGHGKFTVNAITRTAECLQIFGFGIAGMALSTFCQSISYAYENYLEPFKVLFMQLIIYSVIIGGTLSVFGVKAIAFANVCAYSLATIIWVIILKRKYGITIVGKCLESKE